MHSMYRCLQASQSWIGMGGVIALLGFSGCFAEWTKDDPAKVIKEIGELYKIEAEAQDRAFTRTSDSMNLRLDHLDNRLDKVIDIISEGCSSEIKRNSTGQAESMTGVCAIITRFANYATDEETIESLFKTEMNARTNAAPTIRRLEDYRSLINDVYFYRKDHLNLYDLSQLLFWAAISLLAFSCVIRLLGVPCLKKTILERISSQWSKKKGDFQEHLHILGRHVDNLQETLAKAPATDETKRALNETKRLLEGIKEQCGICQTAIQEYPRVSAEITDSSHMAAMMGFALLVLLVIVA